VSIPWLVLLHLPLCVITMYVIRPLVVDTLVFSFVGGARTAGQRGSFWKSVSRRVWGWVFVTLFFGFFGTGISLLPSPEIRNTQRLQQESKIPMHFGKYYEGVRIVNWEDSDVEEVRVKLTFAVLGTIIIIAGIRMLIASYYPKLIRTLIYITLVSIGVVLFTALVDAFYYRTLFDLVLSFEFPESVAFFSTCIFTGCVTTEYLIARFPGLSSEALQN